MRAARMLRLLALGLALPVAAAQAADPFYFRLLTEGSRAYDRGDLESAAHKLRISCFGLLDEPELLAEALARLGLAQDGLDDEAAFAATYERLLELEDRFGAYRVGSLPADLRAAFEEALLRRLPDNALVAAATPGGEDDPAPSPPTPAPGDSGLDRIALEEVWALAVAAQTAPDLERALARARELSDQNPEWVDAHLLAAEVAYRASKWQEAVDYFRRAGGPRSDQTALLFYYAVALYETGEWRPAQTALRQALPRMELTPFVESYRKKILGGS